MELTQTIVNGLFAKHVAENNIAEIKNRAVFVGNPWDDLKEVIVGHVKGATIPQLEPAVLATIPEHSFNFFKENAGKPFPEDLISAAQNELDQFAQLLEDEGILVYRPDETDFSGSVRGNSWQVQSGLYNAMPRDVILPIGNKFILAPTAYRCRYRELDSYLSVLDIIKSKGGIVVETSKPALKNEFYRLEALDEDVKKNFLDESVYKDWKPSPSISPYFDSIINEKDLTFDAADFSPVGKDIFCQLSHVTNMNGIRWVSEILGEDYRIHILPVVDDHPMHIDATFVPLRDKLLLINPTRLRKEDLPPFFDDWKILEAPLPDMADDVPLYFSSKWLSINILVINQNTVVASPSEKSLIKLFEENDFRVLQTPIENFNAFGGSFHCATAEVSRSR